MEIMIEEAGMSCTQNWKGKDLSAFNYKSVYSNDYTLLEIFFFIQWWIYKNYLNADESKDSLLMSNFKGVLPPLFIIKPKYSQ